MRAPRPVRRPCAPSPRTFAAALAAPRSTTTTTLHSLMAHVCAPSRRVDKLAEAKAAPALAPAPAVEPAGAAEPAAALAVDLVPATPEFLDPDLSLRELRVRLLSYGLSTTGLKSELRARLEGAMLTTRYQFKSWDSAALEWK